MTYLVNDPKKFGNDSLSGLVAAHGDYLQQVHGGVVRSTASPDGEVALVIGGGSGHYPAFAGWVGPGMAHGAVCGNIFASPSASQVKAVSKASDNGGGVILMFGNYAGDCLHFGEARDELVADGHDVRIVTISDDIASNTPENHLDRRGIAGDLPVVKVTGAAIAEGADINAAEAVARKANNRTRSLGVAFTGCTLPGADEPLFTVPEGKFALGLGIHGEPGISTHDMCSAEELGALLVDGILAEEPERGQDGYEGRVAVLLNGLGATKYEELFVLYGSVAADLEARGLTIVSPVVGEQVTSLDMAGVSLTLMFLDSQLERLWLAGSDTPAFRTGNVERQEHRTDVFDDDEAKVTFAVGSPESAAQGRVIASIFGVVERECIAAEPSLGKLDSIAGDGDHGQGMVLGAVAAGKAARDAQAEGAGAKSLLDEAGKAWSEGAGGTSGALWGSALRTVAAQLSNEDAVESTRVGLAVVAGARNIAQFGGAKPGDKTMVDATEPFATELESQLANGSDLATAWTAAAAVATKAAEETADLAARKGRARTHGDASLGHPDPGAVSFALLMSKIAEVL